MCHPVHSGAYRCVQVGGRLRRRTPRYVGGAAARWAGDARGRTVVSYRRDGVVLGEHGMYVLGVDGTPVMCRSVTFQTPYCTYMDHGI